MRYWDSSTILPLLAEEITAETLDALLREDGEIGVWWGTWAGCAVAINRLMREGRLDEDAEEGTGAVLDALAGDWSEIRPTDDLRLLAALLSKDHPLKAADALQLAEAPRWCEGDTSGTGFVCLDDRLRQAAQGEGFDVLPGPAEEGSGKQ